MVDVLGLEALLISRTTHVGLTGSASVDVDGVVVGLHIEADLLLLVLSGKGGHLGSVQRRNVTSDDDWSLNGEVDIVDAQLLVEVFYLLIDLRVGDEAGSGDDLLDCWAVSEAGRL